MGEFDIIYRDNYKKLFAIAYKIMNDKDVASDVIQEIFVSYYEKSNNGHIINSPPHWLLRATINKCIDYSKRQKKFSNLDVLNNQCSTDETDKYYSYVALKQAINKLNDRDIKLVVLYSEGYSYKEISQITRIEFTSIGKTLSRALVKLKEILKTLNHETY